MSYNKDEVLKSIQKAKKKMQKEVLKDEQVRPENTSLLQFAGQGTKNSNTLAIFTGKPHSFN